MATRHPATSDLRGGVLVVDKPAGLTSHDVVHVVRRALGQPRVGHTGTLDPAATGVLALVVGRATRLARFLTAADKQYRARIRLGVATDTYDAAGVPTVTSPEPAAWPDASRIRETLAGFVGERDQRPPPFSAKKSGGVPAYERARRGLAVELPAVRVVLHAVDLVSVNGPDVEVQIHCSAGYYVRSLAHDLGLALGVGAHLGELRRTRSGTFRIEDAVELALVLEEPEAALQRVVPIDALLPEWPAVRLDAVEERRVRHGMPVAAPTAGPGGAPTSPVRLVGADGLLLAIAERQADGLLHPAVVLG